MRAAAKKLFLTCGRLRKARIVPYGPSVPPSKICCLSQRTTEYYTRDKPLSTRISQQTIPTPSDRTTVTQNYFVAHPPRFSALLARTQPKGKGGFRITRYTFYNTNASFHTKSGTTSSLLTAGFRENTNQSYSRALLKARLCASHHIKHIHTTVTKKYVTMHTISCT